MVYHTRTHTHTHTHTHPPHRRSNPVTGRTPGPAWSSRGSDNNIGCGGSSCGRSIRGGEISSRSCGEVGLGGSASGDGGGGGEDDEHQEFMRELASHNGLQLRCSQGEDERARYRRQVERRIEVPAACRAAVCRAYCVFAVVHRSVSCRDASVSSPRSIVMRRIVPHRAVLCRIVPYLPETCRIVSYRTEPRRFFPWRIVPYLVVPCQASRNLLVGRTGCDHAQRRHKQNDIHIHILKLTVYLDINDAYISIRPYITVTHGARLGVGHFKRAKFDKVGSLMNLICACSLERWYFCF